jgi:hypothetical protein
VISVSIAGNDKRTVRFDPLNHKDTAILRIRDVSGDGRYLFVAQGRTVRGRAPAYIYDTQTRLLQKVTDSISTSNGVTNAGGKYLPFDYATREFVYLQRAGGEFARLNQTPREIRAAKMDGSTRLIRRVPSVSDSATGFAMHGSRVAWMQRSGDSTSLYLSNSAGETPVKILAMREVGLHMAWSHDGKTMAVAIRQPPMEGRPRTRVVLVAINGTSAHESGRTVIFGDGWDLYWTSDDRSLISLDYSESDFDTRLIRIPLDGSPVSYVLRQGQAVFWDHYPSPDGKYTVAPVESPKGTTLWKIDLVAAEAAHKSRRR